MKKSFIVSAMMLGAAVFGAEAQEVLFDFHNPADLGMFGYSPMSLTELREGTYVNATGAVKDRCYASSNNYVLIVCDDVISYQGVKFEMSNPDKYKDYPRYFFGLDASSKPANPTAADYYSDARWYQTQELVFTAPEGKQIDKIVMDCAARTDKNKAVARQNNETIVQSEGGTQTFSDDKTLNTWTANAGTSVSSVKYKAASGSATQMAYTIAVTLSDAGAAVNEITIDSDAAVRYYDLNGVEHNCTLTPGIYVARQGAKTTKVIIK